LGRTEGRPVSPLIVLAAFWLPGLAVGAAIRLRSWTLLAAAPALTFGVVAVGSLVIGHLGIRWNPLSFGVFTALLAGVLMGVSILLERRSRRRAADTADTADTADQADPPVEPEPTLHWRDHVLVAIGVLAGMAVGVVTFMRGIGNLSVINQDWDAPFHANVIRWIAQHGDPLPSALAPVASAGLDVEGQFFYPNRYHSLLALVLERGGLAMPELLNLAALAIILCWPLGIAALGLAWRMPPVGVAIAAAVSTWFTAFPYDSLWRGPLWPYVAGVALVPATLALARHLIVPRGPAGPVGLALAIGGLVGLHTSLAFVVLPYAVALLAALVLRLEPVRWRTALPEIVATGVLTVVMAVPLVLPALSANWVADFRWPEVASPAEAFGQAMLFSPITPYPQWFLGGAALVGLVLMVQHRRMVWIPGAYLLIAAWYVGCASLDTPLVNAITGPFYNDPWRLAALLPLAGALGVGEFGLTVSNSVTNWVRPRLGRVTSPGRVTSFAMAATVAIAVVAAIGVLGHGAYVDRTATRLAWNHHDGPTVSADEIAAYRWIAEQGNTGRVMNDRMDGSIWLYALTGQQPVEWTFLGSEAGTQSSLLTEEFNKVGEDGDVDRAIADLGVHYVVIGTGFVRDYSRRVPGLENLDQVPYLRQVYANPNAAVYEVQTDLPGATGNGR
jgi:hypothetical protein